MKAFRISILLFFLLQGLSSFGQDTIVNRPKTDTAVTVIKPEPIKFKKHSPKIATRRSLILPGWGQAYNREYWKIPIVWGALGTCAGIWIYNNTWYHRTRFAYSLVVDTLKARYGEIHPKLKYTNTNTPFDANFLQGLRNTFRRDRDYSLLWFTATWILNAVDATVFAHLKNFDVSDDLSVEVKPNLNPFTRSAGLTLAFNIK
jgi:hypothetical protein